MRALAANKLRSILTTLGIVIGVGAVIAVVSVVQGLQQMASGIFADVGATYVIVFPLRPELPQEARARQVKLTWADGQAIRDQVPGVRDITPIVAGVAEVKYGDRQHKPDFVIGAADSFQDVMSYGVDSGRFFSKIDVEAQHKVVVLRLDVDLREEAPAVDAVAHDVLEAVGGADDEVRLVLAVAVLDLGHAGDDGRDVADARHLVADRLAVRPGQLDLPRPRLLRQLGAQREDDDVGGADVREDAAGHLL